MTVEQVEEALASTPDEVGGALLQLRENQWFDRKSAQTKPHQLAVVMCALANAEGGVIVLGLHDGIVEGLTRSEGKLNDFRQAALDHTQPPVYANCREIGCVNVRGEADKLLIVRVDPGERVHELKNGDCYLRVGDESRKLNYTQRQELHFDKGQSQYDGFRADGITIGDLDQDALDKFRKRLSSSEISRALKARSLLTRQGEVTNAAYLLCGTTPQDLFPEAYVRVLRFMTKERGTGARLGLEEGVDHRIEGPIPVVLDAAVAKIEELIPRRRVLSAGGRFEGVPIVPRDAWLEGLVNAIIHRSYSLAGDHIRFEMYPDRIEIESPGRFPGLANPDHPLGCEPVRAESENCKGLRRPADWPRAG